MTNEPAAALPAYAIESVDKALQLLLLLRDRRELRVTDVSHELGVARSTAHRLLATLAHRGFVAQDRVSRSYRAGQVVVEIGLAAVGELDVRRKAREHMERLAAQLHETINLLVLEGNSTRFIDGVESDQQVRVTSRTGTLLPAHATSGGKVLLAELSNAEVDALFPTGLVAVTERTETDPAALHRELALVRRRGYAVNRGETDLGLNAVGVAIRDHTGRAVAALAASVPAQRASTAHLHELVEPLRRTADAISSTL